MSKLWHVWVKGKSTGASADQGLRAHYAVPADNRREALEIGEKRAGEIMTIVDSGATELTGRCDLITLVQVPLFRGS